MANQYINPIYLWFVKASNPSCQIFINFKSALKFLDVIEVTIWCKLQISFKETYTYSDLAF